MSDHSGILRVCTLVEMERLNDSTETSAEVVTWRPEIVAKYRQIINIPRHGSGDLICSYRVEKADPIPVHAKLLS